MLLEELDQILAGNPPVLRSGNAIATQPSRVEPLADGARGHLTYLGDLTCCEDLHRRLSDIAIALVWVMFRQRTRRQPSETSSPLARGSALVSRSFALARVGQPSGSAGIWVGAIRNSLDLAVVQLPLTPRRTNYIGNLGIRKPEKIRKIGKVWFNHPITIDSDSHTQSPANYRWTGVGRADRPAAESQQGGSSRHGLHRQVPPCGPASCFGGPIHKSAAERAFRWITSPGGGGL